jgi:hypothetical protein
MPAIIEYFIKFSLSLSFLYLFYHLFLRKLTFYTWNRWYLLTYSLITFFIPFINVNPIVENQEIKEVKIIDLIPSISNYTEKLSNIVPIQKEAHGINAWTILLSILIGGSFVMLARLCVQLLSIWKMKRNATLINTVEGPIYQVNQRIIPFSFGNSIFMNPDLHTEIEIQGIVLHEYVHVKQRHSVDILIGELMCIVNWYNPFAWLIRYAIRQNLEFIADHLLIHQGLDRKTYQYHLLKVVGTPLYRITNNFNLASLKKRIAMMNAIKSTKLQLLKFLFVLPILSILLLAFRDNYPSLFQNHATLIEYIDAGIVMDGGSTQPLTSVLVKDALSGYSTKSDERGFFKLRIPVKSLDSKINLIINKGGYENTPLNGAASYNTHRTAHFMASIEVLALVPLQNKEPIFLPPVLMTPEQINQLSDPGYEEAIQLYNRCRDDILGVKWIMDFRERPEILDLYNSEDHCKHIVFLKNGSREEYGFPNGPTVTEMQRKYGPLPALITCKDPATGQDYLKRWAQISQEASKVFHSHNPEVREIIFPGDSRVIVVLKDGTRPVVYDMDSRTTNERVQFEKNYGKLPEFVPVPTLPVKMNAPIERRLNSASEDDLKKEDSVPASYRNPGIQESVIDKNGLLKGITLHRGDYMDKEHRDFFKKNPSIWLLHWKLNEGELDIYSSQEKIEKFNLRLGTDSQTVKTKYGEFPSLAVGSYGGVIIKPKVWLEDTLKRFPGLNLDSSGNIGTQQVKVTGVFDNNKSKFSSRINLSSGKGPLILIDGKEGRLGQLKPEDIESIYVSHRIEDIIQFGEKAEAGVDYITSKEVAAKNKYFEYGKIGGITVLHANNSWSGNGITQFFGRVILSLKKTSEDILIIRGSERFDLKQFNELLNNEEFGKVTIYDPQIAKEKYGEDAKGRVIVISTKQEDEEKPVQISLNIPENVIIILDGIEISKEDLSKLDPKEIESMTVWKNGIYLRQFGDKAKNGVIDIKTKSHNTYF